MDDTSTPTLQELIESGRLPVGTKVRFNRRDGTTTATVVADGLRVGKKVWSR